MRVNNKRAAANFEVVERHEAGVTLTGAEAKAALSGRIDLTRAHAKVMGDEVFLINAQIHGKTTPGTEGRRRKLLLHKRQIISLKTRIKSGKLTLMPLSMYNRGNLVKVELGLARARRRHEKKEVKRQRDIDRIVARELKEYR